MNDWNDKKNAILVDNTAQAVFKHLDRIRDNRALLGTRWIWELLQNARDVAPAAGVAIYIEVTDSYLAFRHNGKPFEVQDVIHLIYHGSTKVDLSGAVGRYGSGFISTHLLSPVVRLQGRLVDRARFDFRLIAPAPTYTSSARIWKRHGMPSTPPSNRKTVSLPSSLLNSSTRWRTGEGTRFHGTPSA